MWRGRRGARIIQAVERHPVCFMLRHAVVFHRSVIIPLRIIGGSEGPIPRPVLSCAGNRYTETAFRVWRLLLLCLSDLSGGLSTSPSIPSPPANFFKHDVSVDTTLLAIAATAFQSSYNQSPGFRGRNAGKTWDGGGQVAHDVTDGEGTVFEEDAGEMMLGKETRGDCSNRVQVIQLAETASCQTTLRGVLGLGVLDGIFKVDVRVDMGRSGRSERSGRSAVLVGLGRKRGRDGVGRSGKTSVMLLDGQRSGGHGSEGVLAGPEVVAGLGDSDRLRHSSQSQSDARVGVGTGRSHVVDRFWMVVSLLGDGV